MCVCKVNGWSCSFLKYVNYSRDSDFDATVCWVYVSLSYEGRAPCSALGALLSANRPGRSILEPSDVVLVLLRPSGAQSYIQRCSETVQCQKLDSGLGMQDLHSSPWSSLHNPSSLFDLVPYLPRRSVCTWDVALVICSLLSSAA